MNAQTLNEIISFETVPTKKLNLEDLTQEMLSPGLLQETDSEPTQDAWKNYEDSVAKMRVIYSSVDLSQNELLKS